MSLPKKQKRYYSFLFEDSHLKIARLNEKGTKLVYFYEVKLPEGLVYEGEVRDVQKLGQFLTQLKQQAKIKEDSVIVGIPEYKAVNRNLRLPFLPLDEISEAIRYESSSILPFPFKEEYVDWMLIERTSSGEARVLLNAVPRNVIDGFTSAFEMAKLLPVAFETTSISLFRLVPPQDKNYCFILEVGAVAGVLNFIKNGTIEASSVIQDSSLISSVIEKMKTFYVEESESSEGKEEDAVAPEKKITMEKVKQENQSQQKTQNSKEAQKQEEQKGIKIYLCGKNVTQQLVDQIKNNLKMDPVLINPNVAQVAQNRLLELSVLISLARKEIAPPQDEKTINILPEGLEEKYEEQAQEKKEKSLVTILVILFISLLAANMFFFLKIQNERTNLEIEIERDSASSESIAPEVIQQSTVIVQTDENNKKIQEMFSVILNEASQSAVIRSLGYNSKDAEISVAGTITSRERLLSLKEKLRKTNLFSKIFIPLSSFEQNQQSEFRIRLSL